MEDNRIEEVKKSIDYFESMNTGVAKAVNWIAITIGAAAAVIGFAGAFFGVGPAAVSGGISTSLIIMGSAFISGGSIAARSASNGQVLNETVRDLVETKPLSTLEEQMALSPSLERERETSWVQSLRQVNSASRTL